MDAGERPVRSEAPNRRRQTGLVLIAVVAVLLVWFAVANLQEVTIHFWITTTRSPLIGVIVIAGVLGAVLRALVSRRRRRSKTSTTKP